MPPSTLSFMNTSLPDLLPIAWATDHGALQDADACAAVTRAALDEAIAAVATALAKADDNVDANGEAVPTARYPAAATFARTGCQTALETMQTLRGWLDDNEMFQPPDDHVSNATASFNIFGYCREAITQLHFARQWVAVSASSNEPAGGADPGRDCAQLISGALSLLEPLSADATSCYLSLRGGH